jgi:hypothetical protein
MNACLEESDRPTLPQAIARLESGVGQFLLAVQEERVHCIGELVELDRLRMRLYEVQQAREEVMNSGRPCLTILRRTPRAVSGRARSR